MSNRFDIPDEDLVILLDENDKEQYFELLMTYDLGENVYAALAPLEAEGFEEDEVLIMKVSGEGEDADLVDDLSPLLPAHVSFQKIPFGRHGCQSLILIYDFDPSQFRELVPESLGFLSRGSSRAIHI